MVNPLIRKELLDIKRDKRLLIGTILLPLIMLPLIGIIIYASVAAQPPIIAVINNNPLNDKYVNSIISYITSHGGNVINSTSNITPDAIIIFPQDFYKNVTNISTQAYLGFTVIISSSQSAVNLAYDAIYNLMYNVSISRIHELGRLANVTVNPYAIRDPIVLLMGYETPTKQVTTSTANQLAQIARVVALILFPSSTPVVFFITDGIIGEKERKTLESLIASPITIRQLLFSKLLVSIILGIVSSLGDIVGLLIFSAFSFYIIQSRITFSVGFMGLIVVIYLLTVLLTAALSLVLLLIFGGSVRNIQIIDFIITTFGMIASFSALFLNVTSLKIPLSLIVFIPYVQLAMSLLSYVFGLYWESIFYISVTLIVSVIFILLASKWFDSERILLR
ncbi:MAG: ABC transporter permease [Sulfolobus sp.]|nr:ABC transporter permease [Sulfolobus sp.]